MRKFIYILFLISCSIYSNAQIVARNLALRKPVGINTQTFSYTGSIQQFIVPNRVTAIQVTAIGAKGGTGRNGQAGGAGANITTTLNVISGQVLYIVVGGCPGQSATAKFGFGGSGGTGTNYGGAGGGLSGVFMSASPAIANALVVAGGGGGGSGNATGSDFTGGNAGNNISGTSSNGNEPAVPAYITNSKYQIGYAASNSAAGVSGEPFDISTGTRGGNGSDINGGNGGTDGGIGTWNGAGGGGAGYYGGGGGAGGGAACGGGAGGATKSSTGINSYGILNTTGDGTVSLTCISNSGLVLHLDAGNTVSYIGSGTTWNDLSGNGSNVTLTNTSFSSANGGAIVFNNSTSYADFTANIGSTNVVTVEMWVKPVSMLGSSGGGAMFFGFNLYDVWTSAGNIGYNTSAGDQYGFSSTQADNLGITGSWKHFVFVMNASSKTNNKIYVNGESQAMSQVAGSFGSVNSSFNAGAGRISGWRNDATWKMNMNVANFKVYNRELTQQEITNNFNANKSRFYAEKDGLSPGTASSSAYQIKQDYPSSTDGFYWIKNPNINGGIPFRIYADMTTDGGGWTLIMKNSSYAGWTYANAISYNTQLPFTFTTDVISTATSNYSIVSWADYIKKSTSGFQYMFDAGTRTSYGGIFTANSTYSFVKTDNSQTNVTVNTKFGSWNYVNNNGIAQRMPWYSSTAGAGYGLLTICDGTANWFGTLISTYNGYSPAPWLSDAGGGTSTNINPGIIWYWVR
jgi:hypothetical protein